MLHLSNLSSRNQFGRLLTSLNLNGTAVEIGTHQGDSARLLLLTWQGTLHCVDPYSRYSDSDPASMGDRENDYNMALAILKPYGKRAFMHRMKSEEAVLLFNDNSLDFVYIDGNHEPPHPNRDIEMWYPKIRVGGIIAGHDFICPGEKDSGWGIFIQPAVYNLIHKTNGTVHLIVEENGLPWSWYMVKPS